MYLANSFDKAPAKLGTHARSVTISPTPTIMCANISRKAIASLVPNARMLISFQTATGSTTIRGA